MEIHINHLTKYREQSGLSLEEVADMLKLPDASQLISWERGETLPTVREIALLAFFYRVGIRELYPGRNISSFGYLES